MAMTPPWTTCLLTRMLISYLDSQKQDAGVDYAAVLGDTSFFCGGVEGPKVYLMNDKNWVPHAVLQRLLAAVEGAVGNKEVGYYAARGYFPSGQQSSLMEIIATYLNNVNHVLEFSSLWAAGHTNYLRLQCIPPSDPARCEATLLAQFSDNTTPRIGSFHLVRGCYEGITQRFDDIERALCTEEISQLTIEAILTEFKGYCLERREEPQWADWLFVVDTDSKQEVAAARRVVLQTEVCPAISSLSDAIPNSVNLICPSVDGQYPLIAPRVAEGVSGSGPTVWQIAHQGRLQNPDGTTFLLRTGAYFNAPYSRYRFTWTRQGAPQQIQPPQRSTAIVPLLLRHVAELRETHRRFLEAVIDRQALFESHRSLHLKIENNGDLLGRTGQTPVMQALFEQVRMVAPTDATVLILGETGVGKELLANTIHRSSLRREKMLYTVNCAGLAESLLEMELFGHEKGAYTGALSEKKGLFETAQGGTVFLDEIGECSLAMQAKLLRVLENREVQRIGGRKTLHIDVRILAASNRQMSDCVAAGTFRKDLFYRLNVVSLDIPPLRNRVADLPFLIDYFLEFFSCQYKKPKPSLSSSAEVLLMTYEWPGNVRQLKNEIERAVLFDQNQSITPKDLLLTEGQAFTRAAFSGGSFHDSVEAFRRTVIQTALKKAGGNQTLAAGHLGLQRTYLSRLMRKFGLRAKP